MPSETLNEIRNKLLSVKDDVVAIVNNPWPQTILNPEFSKTSGFLPPLLIPPGRNIFDATPDYEAGGEKKARSGKYNQYEYKDWMGQMITPNGLIELDKKDRFNESLSLKKGKSELSSEPYSIRDHYLIFGDTTTDYFRHGLQIVDGLTPIDDDGRFKLGLSNFKYTPFENNDPVILGFDLIIDDISSPLLNGSVVDFINNYSLIKEIEARRSVYEDFKNQFVKFFKTKSSILSNDINQELTSITRTTSPNSQIGKSRDIYQGPGGNRAYMNYYIQKISGLKTLIEANKPGAFKYLVDYRKDLIKIDFIEDVSMSFGALAHLYKLLYWSKPNGKGMIPENLLRFNCDIIVSECRNFNRVRKALDSGDIEIVKDNVSRYIYSLRECQFFFEEIHEDTIDMGNIKQQGNTPVSFDYKYSTVNFERFVPTTDGFGQYIGYNSGAIWKIGNPGVRNGTQSANLDISIPKFQTFGDNKLKQNGVESPFILKYIGESFDSEEEAPLSTPPSDDDVSTEDLEKNYKKTLKDKAEDLKNRTIESAKRELQTAINVRSQLLARTINKTLISLQGGTISPPRNIYTDAQPGSVGNLANRTFYDIRGELVGFLGGALGGALGGGFSDAGQRR